MTPTATILSVRYCKSSIHSKAAMTYAEAQALLDDDTIQTPIATAVRNLNTIARHLRCVWAHCHLVWRLPVGPCFCPSLADRTTAVCARM